ncbi:MAG: metallophosphoesterase [Amphiplicatus sp.]
MLVTAWVFRNFNRHGGVTGLSGVEYLKLAIFYASWLYFAAAAFLIWAMLTRSVPTRIVAAVSLAPLTILAYARFIEPRLLVMSEHAIALGGCFDKGGAVRLAVFSDTHIGLFANAMPIERIAARTKSLQPDAVLIAGDFTYFLHPGRFAETNAPLGGREFTRYAVAGNHDVGLPGPDVGAPLAAALTRIGVRVIDNRRETLSTTKGELDIVGLSDLWQGRQDMSLLTEARSAPRIVLTHNPNTALDLPPDARVDLLVAGHTHGGQIRIPGVTCAIFQAMCRTTLYGVADTERAKVFVTSGTGMVGLPMRFLVPPRIDVLNISYATCAPS